MAIKRKVLLLTSLLWLLSSPLSATEESVVPTPEALTEQQLLARIMTFLENTQVQNAQMQADLLYQEAPGTDDKAMENGTALGQTDNSTKIKTFIDSQHNRWINFGLYFEGMGASEPRIDLYNDHAKAFCSSSSAVESSVFGSCVELGFPAEYNHGDLKLSNLLNQDYLNRDFQEMSQSFIKNVINPFPEPDASEVMYEYRQKIEAGGSGQLSAENKRKMADALATEAVFSVARHSFMSMLGERVRQEYTDSQNNTQNKSMREILNEEITRRFGDKEWYSKIALASEEALMRELTHMTGLRLWLLKKQYEQGERIEALLASQLAVAERMNRQFSLIMEAANVHTLNNAADNL